MKRLFLLTLVLALFSSCAELGMVGMSNDAASGYVITQEENEFTNVFSMKVKYPGKVRAIYRSYDENRAEAMNRSKDLMLSEVETKKATDELIKGGFIELHFFRQTIDAGNTDNFEYILKQEGKIIKRIKPKPRIPSIPSHGGVDGSYWTNIDIIPLYDDYLINGSLEIYVVDTLIGGSDKFVLAMKKDDGKN